MKNFQRINHFPGMSEICRKDLLSRNLTRYELWMVKRIINFNFKNDEAVSKRVCFLPTNLGSSSWPRWPSVLYEKQKESGIHMQTSERMSRQRRVSKLIRHFFGPIGCNWKNSISNPSKGIYITRKPIIKDKESDSKYIYQQYIDKPLLIDGFKFDLRVYVLVTSCDPLR